MRNGGPAGVRARDAADHPRLRGALPGLGRHDDGLLLVVVLVAIYSALHIGFRLAASWSLGEDDPIENILVQDLRPLYDPRQPPLYDWVLYGVQQLFGPTIVSFLAVKYAALVATAALLFSAARRAIGGGVLALMAVESLALIYQMSWRFHEGFTHQVGAMVAVVATLWAMLRLIERRQTGDFLVLGLIAGLGTLTEPIFVLFAASLLAAVAVEPGARGRLFERRLSLTALPIAASAGFYLWHALGMATLFGLAGSPAVPTWRQAGIGFLSAARAPLFYLSPLILILPLLFPGVLSRMALDLAGALRPAPSSELVPQVAGEPGLLERIVLRTSVLAFLISVAGAAALGLRGYPSHVFMPLYITSVVWLMGTVRRADPSPRALELFGRLALAIAVLALVARLANMFVLDPVCKICRWGIPYPGLAAEMRAAGAEGAVLVTIDRELGGNLRAVLPRSKVVLHRGRPIAPAGANLEHERLMLVWDADTPTETVLGAFAPIVRSAAELREARLVRVPWRHLWRPDGYRSSEWRLLTIARR